MRKIKLSQGKYAIVDDNDFEWLNQWKWYLGSNKRYATRCKSRKLGKKRVYLHRLIMDAKKGEEVDHINGDKIDNRRENLRICTTMQNKHNYKIPITNTSGYKGVGWHKRDKKWTARIRVNYKLIHLGYYVDKIEAALAYNKAAIKYHKEFARLNKI